MDTSGKNYLTRNWVKGSPLAVQEIISYGNTFELNNLNGEHDPILIDDNGGTADAYTWAEIDQLTYWITGSGTGNDPYIIEDLIIDGHQADSSISIIDSEEVFIIQNCVLTNSTDATSYDAGINLDDTTNGTIQYNNISWNIGNGICLRETSENITIFNNTIHNNYRGIYFFRGDNSNITENVIYTNTDEGIYLYQSENNLIYNNTIYDSGDNGIQLWYGEFTEILNNTIYNCADAGILLDNDSFNNTMSGNSLYNNGDYGIYMSESSSNNITWNIMNNEVSNAQNHGIRLYDDCDFNLIQYNSKGHLVSHYLIESV